MPKILVLDNLSDEGVNVFRNADGFDVDVMPPQKPDELSAIIGDYDGLVIRSATKVPAEVFDHATNLKVIGRAGVGTDNIDKEAATRHGVVVMNTPGGNTISTCEHTLALMLALLRNVPKAHQSMAEGRWDRKKFMGSEVRGKTLGIIGVGRIGAEVAKRAQAFEMKVIAFDPILTEMKAEALGVELCSAEEVIAKADIISIHAPKTEKTNNMIAMPQLKQMKPTAVIVNCARGGIVNEADLAKAVKDGIIAGAALDVYTSEPFENNPFIGIDNIVTTPHLAASTEEAQLSVAVDIADQMVDYLSTGAIVNAVNVPSLDAEASKTLGPLQDLAKRLGKFQSNYLCGRPSKIDIEYLGDMELTDTYPITTAVFEGFLEPLVETVNSISAPFLLKEHGIASSETRQTEPTDYAFEMRVTVTTDTETVAVSGTLFGRTDARICKINDIHVDAEPYGCMLVCTNEDKPMIIGRLGMMLGEAEVNIANMTLGRDERGGHALTVLNLDQPVDDDLLAKIAEIPHVNQARLVVF